MALTFFGFGAGAVPKKRLFGGASAGSAAPVDSIITNAFILSGLIVLLLIIISIAAVFVILKLRKSMKKVPEPIPPKTPPSPAIQLNLEQLSFIFFSKNEKMFIKNMK
jgi:hypothetical protein